MRALLELVELGQAPPQREQHRHYPFRDRDVVGSAGAANDDTVRNERRK